jgi:hypothetical protein
MIGRHYISKILPCYVGSIIAFFWSRTDCDRRELIFVYFAAFDELKKKKKQKKLSFCLSCNNCVSHCPSFHPSQNIELANWGNFRSILNCCYTFRWLLLKIPLCIIFKFIYNTQSKNIIKSKYCLVLL